MDSNMAALIGYANDRARIYHRLNDRISFFNELDQTISPQCMEKPMKLKEETKAFGVRAQPVSHHKEQSRLDRCETNKVDLMIVLDTSGSVYKAFADEREFAKGLIQSINSSAFVDGRLQVGLIRFSSAPSIVIPFSRNRTQDEIVEKISEIEFTGQSTRIAAAVDLAIAELETARRKDATQVFILISDGHGQEYWSVVQATGKKLQSIDAEVFSATTSQDYNFAELLLYTGDKKRIFIGPKHAGFISTISPLINKCLRTEAHSSPSQLSMIPLPDEMLWNESSPEQSTDLNVEKSVDPAASNDFEKSSAQKTSSEDVFSSSNTSTSSEVESKEAVSAPVNSSASGVEKLSQQDHLANIVAAVHETLQNDGKSESNETLADSTEERDGSNEFLTSPSQLPSTEAEQQNNEVQPEVLLSTSPVPLPNTDAEEQNNELQSKVLPPNPGPLLAIEAEQQRTKLHSRVPLSKEPHLIQVEPARGGITEAFGVIKPAVDQKQQRVIIESPLSLSPENGQCDVDLIFVIDRSMSVEADFQEQLKFATELVQRIMDKDLSASRIRVAAISFNKEAKVEFEFGANASKEDIISKLLDIEHTGGETSAVSGISMATKLAHSTRRPSANLMIVLISDGNSQDQWKNVVAQSNALRSLPNTAVYAVTFSKNYSFDELRQFAGDKWRVFVDARARKFINDAANELSGCPGEKKQVAQESPKKVNESKADACKDAIDLVLVLDKSSSVVENFDAAKKFAEDLVKSASVEDYAKRIRVAFVTFDKKSQLEFGLDKFSNRDDISFALERAESTAGETSTVSGLRQAISEIEKNRRDGARLIVVLFSDGGSTDLPGQIKTTAEQLHDLGAEVYAVTVSDQYKADELLAYTADPERLLIRLKDHEPEFTKLVALNECRKEKSDQLNGTTESVAQPIQAPKSPVPSSSTNKLLEPETENKSNNRNEAVIKSVPLVKDVAASTPTPTEARTTPTEARTTPTAARTTSTEAQTDGSVAQTTASSVLADSDCKVDLMFIIDRSESVEKEFQKQLQFAVDLVKRLSSNDFASRVRVGAVSFHSTAELEFAFDQYKEQSKVLNALMKIEHFGGSTSAVSGVNLAVDEITRTGRKDARRMVVLISDGNSQDPWDDVLKAADRLRSIGADVYAVTVSHDYMIRELEQYAGNKWLVYIDARIRQFLDEAEKSVTQCVGPNIPSSTPPPRHEPGTTPQPENQLAYATHSPDVAVEGSSASAQGDAKRCREDPVDVMIILDTSTSVEHEFYAEKKFATDLIEVLPEEQFADRIKVSLVRFAAVGTLQFGFGEQKTRGDVLYELDRVENTGGSTSLVKAANEAIKEINKNHRANARLVVVFVTDGNSQDPWRSVQKTSEKLLATDAEVYVVTLSPKYFFDELKQYAGSEDHVYIDDRANKFIQEVGTSVVTCVGDKTNKAIPSANQQLEAPPPSSSPSKSKQSNDKSSEKSAEKPSAAVEGGTKMDSKESVIQTFDRGNFARDEMPVQKPSDSLRPDAKKCQYAKMDLEIILDASSSRSDVFENQRELALSLIERLPIDAGDTHVAVGVNSFTSTPTLRQTLGLGRQKQMVRHAIEDIKYTGGSTLTAQAVELSVQDLQRGRRPDAIQVVVLMNDGMSQDPWDKVLSASELLRSTGAERFGVALGDKVDLRELKHYIGDEKRIYRDGSTERFLSDVVSLLTGGEECEETTVVKPLEKPLEDCKPSNVDLMVVFDNSDVTSNLSDPSVGSNRYLLLDLLGSLPTTADGKRIKLSIISFADEPDLLVTFNDNQKRDAIFRKVEGIEPEHGKPKYAKALNFALEEYEKSHRADARGILLIVGDGRAEETDSERNAASKNLRKQGKLSCFAVDSGKSIDQKVLSEYTGSADRVYNYDKNAEFAKKLLAEVAGPNCIKRVRSDSRSAEKSSEKSLGKDLLRDIGSRPDNTLKQFEGEKVIVKAKNIVAPTLKRITPRPTVASSRRSSTRPSRPVSSTPRSASKRLTTKSPLADSKSKQLTRKQSLTSRLPTVARAKIFSSTARTPSTRQPSTASPIITRQQTTKLSTKPSVAELKTTSRPRTTLKSIITSRITPQFTRRPTNKTTVAITSRFTTRPTTTRLTTRLTTPRPTTPTRSPTPTAKPFSSRATRSTTAEPVTEFKPGCLVDLMIIIDSSGSVEDTFVREKELAGRIIDRLRIGPDNARVALIKFAAKEKVKTVWSFDRPQSRSRVLDALNSISFSSGITAIHTALLQAITEYSAVKGARPGKATPIAIVFTDGFGQQDISESAALLRKIVPNVYAVAINHEYPVSRTELERIAGSTERVFTDANIESLQSMLKHFTSSC